MSVDVINKIDIYEINDEEVNEKTIQVNSHWSNKRLIVLKIDKKSYTISVDDLEKAIKNASNI